MTEKKLDKKVGTTDGGEPLEELAPTRSQNVVVRVEQVAVAKCLTGHAGDVPDYPRTRQALQCPA